MPTVTIVGGGLGGMAAAITAAEAGLDVTLVEKSTRLGGAAAYSGGQVWIGANHVAARAGLEDDARDALAYVQGVAARDPDSLDPALSAQWLSAARSAARWFEDLKVIDWEILPDYPDYYFPEVAGSRPVGRYLTGAPFAGGQLGEHRSELHVSPHFPVGITYDEMFAWGGMSSKTQWDWGLVERRRREDVLTFGPGIAAAFFKGVLDRGVRVLLEHAAVDFRSGDGGITGVRCVGADGDELELAGPVILATGAHDWSEALSQRFTGIPEDDGGSVAPESLTGDAVGLVEAVGGSVAALPAWAAPVLPGYCLSAPAFEGDTGYRACYEHCLPHTFIVNRLGRRFCDDSFHSRIVAAALKGVEDGEPANVPMFMVWDSQHHQRYGLGATMPGDEYPDGLVVQAPTLEGVAERLGIDGTALAGTAARFNDHAVRGEDPDHGRGSNLSVRRFRGDWSHEPNPCLGPVCEPPFFGMRMRLLNTGIAAAGVRAGTDGRVLREDGSAIPGLYAVGECSSRAAAGVGYNSGYSLSRAMAFGYLAGRHVAEAAGASAPAQSALPT